MNRILEIVLFNAVAATVLAAVAASVGRTVRRPALVHCLWVLVLVKLITPPFFRIPVVEPPIWPMAPQTAATHVVVQPPASRPEAEDSSVHVGPDAREAGIAQTSLRPADLGEPNRNEGLAESGLPSSSFVMVDARESAVVAENSTAYATEPVPSASPVGMLARCRPENWFAVAVGVWLLGSAAFFVLAAIRIWRFHRVLRFAEPAPAALQDQMRRLAHAMGIGRCPGVWLVPGPVSPMLWAIGPQARLVFPTELLERLSAESRATLLAHELAHFHRRDHWVRMLELIATGLYWWHPVVWWARREIQRAEEECCDAWVVWELPRAARRYAEALLDTIDFLSEARPALPPAASGIGHVRLIRRRLTMIMRGAAPRTLSAFGRFAVLVVAAVFLPLLPTWAKPHVPRPDVVDLARTSEPDADDLDPTPDPPASSTLVDRIDAPTSSVPTVDPEIWVVANSPDGQKMVRAGANRFVEFSNTVAGRAVALTALSIRSVAFAPDSQTFATGGGDHTVRLWDAETGDELAALAGHGDVVTSVTFAPDGRTLATASWDKTVRLWDVATHENLATLTDVALPVNCVRFAPDSRMLAAAAGDWRTAQPGEVRLWDAATLAELGRFECSSGAGAAAFSPDGKTLAAGEWNGRVRLWDVATRDVQDERWVHKNQISCEAFAPNGLAQGPSADPVLRTLWDALTLVQQTRSQRWRAGLFDAITLPALDGGAVKLFEMNTRSGDETEASGPGAALMGRPRASGHPLVVARVGADATAGPRIPETDRHEQ